ncbi:nucleoside ABC transporter membrane protein [Thermanaeromonas toyohensis ToBE]|uniref:Nucleoside ABC transporter membrane protein n=1 Tax=Thermanaeromonas toyohensis ToBE TaxID=698762 RepID=A0A1W1W050_9FIRM|nr:ABC transporter permease [Thermanaeromonas toyohensis]SMB98751.1 nucleoside ABC transporter membrane protein [Thermanaeromonas toyohensis ToBE]
MSIVELLASSIRLTIPILLAALGAVYSERSGIVNIALEGMMITGSFWGAVGTYYYGPLVGVLLAIFASVVLAFIHALVTVTFRVDQIVSGVALNILAYGAARFSCLALFEKATMSPHVDSFSPLNIPLLDRIPYLGVLFTNLSPLIVLGFVLVPVSYWVIQKTVFGLRLRSVGENPLAADTLGINVYLFRYSGVLISGILAGLAGAYLSIEHTGMYVEGMTQGKGYIGLAAMIFGNWSPVGAMWAALLFGFAEALSLRVVESGFVPYQFIKMIPYVLTLVVLAGVFLKARPPAADGIPYGRDEG